MEYLSDEIINCDPLINTYQKKPSLPKINHESPGDFLLLARLPGAGHSAPHLVPDRPLLQVTLVNLPLLQVTLVNLPSQKCMVWVPFIDL